MPNQNIITVFGSYEPAPGSDQYQQAYHLGQLLARAGWTVANGGYAGTMEASAKGAKDSGGATVGVTCTAFSRSSPNPYIDREISTPDLRHRLDKLIEIGAGYVVLPGGTGTLTELAHVWELLNKKFLPSRPLVILGPFWLPLVRLLENANPRCRNIVQSADTPDILIEILGPAQQKGTK